MGIMVHIPYEMGICRIYIINRRAPGVSYSKEPAGILF